MPTRREFLRLSAAAAAAGGLIGALPEAARAFQDPEERRRILARPLPKRDLGRTGLRVGALGLGCFYLGNLRDEDAAVGVIRRALDLGVDWFDTAPSYNRGVSEERVGKALKGARDRVRIATKSLARDGPGARAELLGSLKRLDTDRVDLFQFHAVKGAKDVRAIFGEGGAHAEIAKARKEGKVLHVGFTGHFDPDLMAAVCREREVETVLMPLNCLDPHEKSFEKGTLPAAREKGLGVIAMKLFASGRLVDDPALSPTPEECVRYSLGLAGVSVAISGCSSVAELERDLLVAKAFEPLSAEQRAALLDRTRPFVERRLEWYKR
jgi:aryl-alcohol dehydrogenase-like predicted oxidoreductase